MSTASPPHRDVHDAACGKSLRERLLGQWGSPDPVPPDILRKIAEQIHQCCGHGLLKCHRLAAGWTVVQAVRTAHDLVAEQHLRPVGLTERSWKDWEAGAALSAHYQDLVSRMFATGPVQLGLARDYSAPRPAPTETAADPEVDDVSPSLPAPPGAAPFEGDATNRRTALKLITLTATAALEVGPPSVSEAFAFTQELERTDLGPGTLDQLQEQIEAFAADYAASPPAAAWPQVMALRAYAARLLAGRHTLGQGQDLAHAAGMLSVVLAWLAQDLGQPRAALAYCADARAHGTAAAVGDVCAWADDAAATTCLYADQPHRAAQYAGRGLSTATSTSARVRLAAQTARAQARSGNTDAFTSARSLAHEAAAGLPQHASGLFSADQVRLLGFDATSYLALGKPRPARAAAEDAVAQYDTAVYRSPTRAAIAHLDLADAHAALGSLDAALAHGTIALRSDRPADAIHTRAQHLANVLTIKDPRSPAVQAFVQQLAC
ncbi:hypothetical protein [Streptomyces sp. RKAG293]|uniref:hypothetical protein n=1 Tax=Streptomyces sp. RKAG293 TaxID=2893403 RepID=UPI0020347FF1|nr:hypothetical protein [Streptomyces sp. RKAG293]MCM2424166.1 hypothetical protein [Streptomyces sp. RKAG293]